jgi:hypothetical protein
LIRCKNLVAMTGNKEQKKILCYGTKSPRVWYSFDEGFLLFKDIYETIHSQNKDVVIQTRLTPFSWLGKLYRLV